MVDKVGIEEIEKAISAIEKAIAAIQKDAAGSVTILKSVDWAKVSTEAADLDANEMKKLALQVIVIIWNTIKDFIDAKTLLLLLLKLRK